jgi:hypothetical protein
MILCVAATSLSGGTPATRSKPKDTDIPCMCFTQAWDQAFKVTGGRYDPARKELSWDLQAKQSGWHDSYEAFVADGDNVELATIEVKITPDDKLYKKGAKFRAVVALNDISAADAAKLTIRKRN